MTAVILPLANRNALFIPITILHSRATMQVTRHDFFEQEPDLLVDARCS